jgi:hypothetical protein
VAVLRASNPSQPITVTKISTAVETAQSAIMS